MCKHKTYNLLSAGFFATFGLWIIALTFDFDGFSHEDIAYINQIAVDWNTQPFISLVVTRNTFCQPGQDEVIYKPWLGTKTVCIADTLGLRNISYGGRCQNNGNPKDPTIYS